MSSPIPENIRSFLHTVLNEQHRLRRTGADVAVGVIQCQ
ncbi:MAG: hypothetical protein BWX80_00929 [Candidatus Hydrogenedentes bacterium ADurb.Bin101]|nr:MAG: hypothetical protein BWX80_00929 [Candidatus Hydrogenedentes bacterium ADurb.Bin101]